MSTSHADIHAQSHGLAHPVPLKILVAVILVLLFLTWMTVAATWVDLGEYNLWIAMGIAVVKATLVALYFMHLWWDNLVYSIVLIGALCFVALFIGVTLTDTIEYQPGVTSTPAQPTTPPGR